MRLSMKKSLAIILSFTVITLLLAVTSTGFKRTVPVTEATFNAVNVSAYELPESETGFRTAPGFDVNAMFA